MLDKRTPHTVWLLDGVSLGLYLGFAYALARWVDGQAAWAYVLIACLGVRVIISQVRERILHRAIERKKNTLLHGLIGQGHSIGAPLLAKAPNDIAEYLRFVAQKQALIWALPVLVLLGVAHIGVAMAVLISLPVLVVCMIVIGKKTSQKSRDELAQMTRLSDKFLDWFAGANTLTRLGARNFALDDIVKSSEQYRVRVMAVLRLAFANNFALEIIATLMLASAAIFLAFAQFNIAKSVWILLLVPEVYAPFRRLGASYHAKAQGESAYQALRACGIDDITSTQSVVDDYPINAYPPSIEIDTQIHQQRRTRLAPTRLQIGAGERVALMGKSGAGKSSLLLAIAGILPHDGRITLMANNAPYAGQIAYLGQVPPILAQSVRQNLANACACDDGRMVWALEQVGLWQSLAQKQGLDTMLQSHGYGLSGGEVARLALAQLILFDAPLWLLDEPFGALDSQSRVQVVELLANLSVGKTVIIAQHEAPFGFENKVVQL